MNSARATNPSNGTDASLAALVGHAERVAALPAESIAPLLAAVAAQQAAFSSLQGMLTSRLLEREGTPPEPQEHLLTADEVARTLGVTTRWGQRRARRSPFARMLSEHAIRYSEVGLNKRWMAHRQTRTA
jgi:hypothetical protein